MRFRLLVSFPFSLLIVGMLLVSASSFVSAIETPQEAPLRMEREEAADRIERADPGQPSWVTEARAESPPFRYSF